MKTPPANPPLPSPEKMADALLNSSSQMILDHYSATQGRRVLQLMQSNPTELLAEMFQAVRRLNLAQVQLAKARGLDFNRMESHQQAEMLSEAYQSLYPATETAPEDELTPAQRQSLDAWLESLAPAVSA